MAQPNQLPGPPSPGVRSSRCLRQLQPEQPPSVSNSIPPTAPPPGLVPDVTPQADIEAPPGHTGYRTDPSLQQPANFLYQQEPASNAPRNGPVPNPPQVIMHPNPPPPLQQQQHPMMQHQQQPILQGQFQPPRLGQQLGYNNMHPLNHNVSSDLSSNNSHPDGRMGNASAPQFRQASVIR